jgi:hypothetical protein
LTGIVNILEMLVWVGIDRLSTDLKHKTIEKGARSIAASGGDSESSCIDETREYN